LRVSLDNGSQLEADIVLSAIGLKPRTQLAQTAGLEIKRGIVVDHLLETSAPNVYALGDCAEVSGMVLPFVMPLMHAARALAATLAGDPTSVRYPAMPVAVKTPACPTVVSPPPANASGEWRDSISADGVKSLFADASGRLLGFALNGTATVERASLTRLLPPVLP
jgi:rubredoxin-NAD+ reductase